ncbi:PAS domain-containing sensor histidine kinase [Bacteroidota bacterium]
MGFNNYTFNIVLRIIVLTLTVFLLAYLINQNTFIVTILLVLTLVVLQVISVINFIEKTNKEINMFFDSISHGDFSKRYPENTESSYTNELNSKLNLVINKLKKVKTDREAKFQYIKTIVQHVGIGIVTFNRDGEIQIINTAAKKLFKTSNLRNINQLKNVSESLVESFLKLKTGGRDLIKIVYSDETIQLSVFAIELTLQGEEFKLVSVQNIQTELEENEMEAWQKLVRVLTHEIMNSVTPISSLANTVEEDLKDHMSVDTEKCEMTREDLEDLHLAVQTIQKRSDGLIRFVTDFRSLTHIPKIEFSMVMISELFNQIETLMRSEMEQSSVNFDVTIAPEDMELKIDKELIEQVLINLIKNAIQALDEVDNRQIYLSAYRDSRNQTCISVRDNGTGIDEEAQTKIFIPFYTTKKSGSGIGLSLSKQIMRQHLGTISVKSKVDEGTEFVLRF